MNAELDWIAAIGLPARWRGRPRFVLFESADGGAGHLALIDAWCRAWRGDAERCAELHIIVVDSQATSLAPNIHRLSFEDGAVVALVVPMTLDVALAELVARVDVFHVDASRVDTSRIDRRAMKGFGRLASDGARIVLESATEPMRAALVTAGFRFHDSAIGSRSIATFEPRDMRGRSRQSDRQAPGREPVPSCSSRTRAIVIGAGLAGCATAWALAERGWQSTVVDTHDHVAASASGNPAGLFHGIFNRQDGRHARFNRGAAFEAAKAVRIAIDGHGARGAVCGVIRIEGADADAGEMQAAVAALALPAGYIEALDAFRVSHMAGMPLTHAGWFYPGGGWVDPAALARSFIERARGRSELRLGRAVACLRRVGASWRLLDEQDAVIDEAETVVLANAHDALRLLNTIDDVFVTGSSPIEWPLTLVRGQVSVMPSHLWPDGRPPLRPLTGSGYVAAIDGGRVMFGSTSQPNDADSSVRLADHLANLERLDAWVAGARAIDPDLLDGRTAWRCVAADRLPVIGAVPLLSIGAHRDGSSGTEAVGHVRLDRPRLVPREPGLFVHTALGSRGITWAALGAETLAALITGAPCPIEASLLEAIDPARFVSRRARRDG